MVPKPSPTASLQFGAPVSVGEKMVGDVPNASAPVAVSSVIAGMRLALDGVARKVATLAAGVKVDRAPRPSAGVVGLGPFA